MDERCEIHGGWRVLAARELGKERIWVAKCADRLLASGLVDTAPGKRYVKVLVSNIQG